jgi:hypothetical protein
VPTADATNQVRRHLRFQVQLIGNSLGRKGR